VKRLDDFSAEFGQGCGKHAMGSSRATATVFRHIDLLRQFRSLTVHMEQLHGSRKNDDSRAGPLVGKRFCWVRDRKWIAHTWREFLNVIKVRTLDNLMISVTLQKDTRNRENFT